EQALSTADAYTPPCTTPHGVWCSGPASTCPMTSVARTWSTTSAVAWTKALEAAREVSGSWLIPASEHDRLGHLAEVGLADGPEQARREAVGVARHGDHAHIGALGLQLLERGARRAVDEQRAAA